MKHIVAQGPKTSIIKDVPNVKPTDNQVLIKIKYVGVCMSEHDDWATAAEGTAFGHEPLGQIIEVGKNITDYAVGDMVSGLWGSSLPGGGGMVEYAVADPSTDVVVKLPADSPVRLEDLVLEPLACLMSAISKVELSMPGTTIAVVGCGYMGCGAISLLKLRGAKVVAIDIRPECLEDAKTYGADQVYLADQALANYKDQFDLVMEWGETDAALDLAINLTAQCGKLYIGAYHTGSHRTVDMQQLNVKAIQMLSVHPREKELSRQGAHLAAQLLLDGSWNYKNLPVKIYPRDQFDQAQGELRSKYGKYMKALIDMEAETGAPYVM